MKTLLLYNPVAGTHRSKRKQLLNGVIACLTRSGFAITAEATKAAGTGGAQARQAIDSGYEAVFACGGDGTIHEVLQGVVGTSAAFGILPFGSANALARELGLHHNPVKAAATLKPGATAEIQVGVVRRSNAADRHFLSMAGAGPDGALMYRMLTVNRNRWGRLNYYSHAAHLFISQSFPDFEVSYMGQNGQTISRTAIAVMALRIGSMGGIFSGISQGASLRSPDMLLLIVHSPAWLSLPLWFVSSWTRSARFNSLLTTVRASGISIQPPGVAQIHLQADGEWLGRGGCSIELGETRVRMFVPQNKCRAVELREAKVHTAGS